MTDEDGRMNSVVEEKLNTTRRKDSDEADARGKSK